MFVVIYDTFDIVKIHALKTIIVVIINIEFFCVKNLISDDLTFLNIL